MSLSRGALVIGVVVLPSLLHTEAPRVCPEPGLLYPMLAAQAQIEGAVSAVFKVGDDGTLKAIKKTTGHGLLKAAVAQWLSKRRFTPPAGRAAAKRRIEVEFVLGDLCPSSKICKQSCIQLDDAVTRFRVESGRPLAIID